MANQVITAAAVAKESLRLLVNNLQFAGRMNRDYSDNFGNKEYQIGDTINIRKPARYTVRKGRVFAAQDHVDRTIPLKLTDQAGVDLSFTSADLALRLPEFSKKFLKGAIESIAHQVDFEALALYKDVHNAVGTPGTTPASSLVYLQAGGKLDEEAAPRDSDRTILINPEAQVQTIEALKSLFNSQGAVSEQYMTGEMGKALGFTFGMSQQINTHTVGPLGGAPVVNGAAQVGFNLVTNGWTAAAAARLKKGDIITIANVVAVNPMTRQSTGKQRQFVVTADVSSDAAGNATIPIYPGIIPVGGTGAASLLLQPPAGGLSGTPGYGPDNGINDAAYATVLAAPANGAAITVLGAANTLSPANMAWHKDAFQMGCVELPLPGGVDFAGRASSKSLGLSIRIIRAYDINNDAFPCRLDILYGFKTVFPELACRVMG
jgi:hypothetical protein